MPRVVTLTQVTQPSLGKQLDVAAARRHDAQEEMFKRYEKLHAAIEAEAKKRGDSDYDPLMSKAEKKRWDDMAKKNSAAKAAAAKTVLPPVALSLSGSGPRRIVPAPVSGSGPRRIAPMLVSVPSTEKRRITPTLVTLRPKVVPAKPKFRSGGIDWDSAETPDASDLARAHAERMQEIVDKYTNMSREKRKAVVASGRRARTSKRDVEMTHVPGQLTRPVPRRAPVKRRKNESRAVKNKKAAEELAEKRLKVLKYFKKHVNRAVSRNKKRGKEMVIKPKYMQTLIFQYKSLSRSRRPNILEPKKKEQWKFLGKFIRSEIQRRIRAAKRK